MISPDKAKKRAERCVCKMCGSALESRLVVYNHYGGSGVELYCPHCQRIEYGTEEAIYQLAKSFVESVEFDYFTDLEEGERHYQLNISKVCELLAWVYRRMQILDADGIKEDKRYLFEEQS